GGAACKHHRNFRACDCISIIDCERLGRSQMTLSQGLISNWTPMLRRFLLLPLLLTVAVSCNNELSDTLSWMDNTYNPHEHNVTGHGKIGWYAEDKTNRFGQILVFELTQTFTHQGCQMTLREQGNPNADDSREMYSNSTATFNLRDINPQSIKMSPVAH